VSQRQRGQSGATAEDGSQVKGPVHPGVVRRLRRKKKVKGKEKSVSTTEKSQPCPSVQLFKSGAWTKSRAVTEGISRECASAHSGQRRGSLRVQPCPWPVDLS